MRPASCCTPQRISGLVLSSSFVLENMYTSSQLLPVPKLTMINRALEKQGEPFHVELRTEAHPTSHQHSGGEPESTRQWSIFMTFPSCSLFWMLTNVLLFTKSFPCPTKYLLRNFSSGENYIFLKLKEKCLYALGWWGQLCWPNES